MSQRLDKELVSRGLCSTRSQASVLIKKGEVLLNSKVVLKTGALVSELDKIVLSIDKIYVGRGAYKLLHAIKEFNLNFSGSIIADCGASTGGFTEVALEAGADKVFAIDVGHDQLAQKIKEDSRVKNLEGINLKDQHTLEELVDFCVADLSFISLKLVYPTIHSFLKPGGFSVVLIKPQFEAGRERLGKGGVVRDRDRAIILEEVLNWLEVNDYKVGECIESPIKGKDGNVEYLALIKA